MLALLLLLAADPSAEAQRLFESGDFEAALKRLDAGLKADPPPRQRAQLQLSRARCLSALRRNADIEAAMEAALGSDPTVQLDAADVSPGFRATFDRVRARLAGTVTVETEPPGAAVRIDGALVGPSPVTQLLPVGRYRVGVLDEAGQETARELVVAPRQKQTLVLQLAAASSAPAAEPVAASSSEVQAPAASRPWPVELAAVVRTATDFRGVAFEAGAAVLGRYFVVEVDAIFGGTAGAGLRAGGRLPFVDGLFALQLTADGVAFFQPSFAPGGGATLSFGVHPVDFLDVLLDASARFLAAAPGWRSQYFLGGVTVRARWPTGLDSGR